MNRAIDTNVVVRLLVRDDEKHDLAAKRLVQQAASAGEPILIVLMAILETEWVLRSHYQLDKASIAQAFAQLLEGQDVVIENAVTLEEALCVWALNPSADFSDCLLAARAAHLGAAQFLTFDVRASELPGAALLV